MIVASFSGLYYSLHISMSYNANQLHFLKTQHILNHFSLHVFPICSNLLPFNEICFEASWIKILFLLYRYRIGGENRCTTLNRRRLPSTHPLIQSLQFMMSLSLSNLAMSSRYHPHIKRIRVGGGV